MAKNAKWRLFAVCVVCLVLKVNRATASQEVMKKLTLGFSKAIDQCKKELNLPDHIIQDFYNFWREEYELVNKELGCAIICLTGKLGLIDDENNMHHGNAHEFAKTHGADDEMAKQLVTIIHECEKTNAGISDECSRTLETAKCFRTKIHALKWAPSMEAVLEEIMTDIK